MKAIEQYFKCNSVYCTVQSGFTFKSVDETIVYSTIQLKAIEQYFYEVLFNMLYKVHVVLTGFNLSIHKIIPTS